MTKDIAQIMHEIGARAQAARLTMASATAAQKDTALREAARHLRGQAAALIDINAADIARANEQQFSAALIDRLTLNASRIEAMAKSLEDIAALPDPVGKTLSQWEGHNNGLHIERIAVPLGVIGIIYESRPNVTSDAAGLCIKSGNCAILRAGTESHATSTAIWHSIEHGLQVAGLPLDAVIIVPTTDRQAVGVMLTMNDSIDVLIPRGGASLTKRVAAESRVPTLLHLDGNCHTYIHTAADPAMAIEVALNAKMRRTGVCGATESIVIDEAVVDHILPKLADRLLGMGCVIRGDARAQMADDRIERAHDHDWSTEYLDAIISIKTVKDISQAILHINHYGSHHTDAIISADKNAVALFCKQVDSAIVMANSSTQFADGGEFGMGAEIGIATGRLHARGPVGCEQLTTYKYVVTSHGATRR